MLTRREFFGAGLGAAVDAHASALPGDRMRYAMSGQVKRNSLIGPGIISLDASTSGS